MVRRTQKDLPFDRRVQIAEHNVENAEAAVEHLPAVEAAARARVEEAEARLRVEQENLRQVVEVEIPATKAAVGQAAAALAELKRRGK